jgi:hypothetical protein
MQLQEYAEIRWGSSWRNYLRICYNKIKNDLIDVKSNVYRCKKLQSELKLLTDCKNQQSVYKSFLLFAVLLPNSKSLTGGIKSTPACRSSLYPPSEAMNSASDVAERSSYVSVFYSTVPRGCIFYSNSLRKTNCFQQKNRQNLNLCNKYLFILIH